MTVPFDEEMSLTVCHNPNFLKQTSTCHTCHYYIHRILQYLNEPEYSADGAAVNAHQWKQKWSCCVLHQSFGTNMDGRVLETQHKDLEKKLEKPTKASGMKRTSVHEEQQQQCFVTSMATLQCEIIQCTHVYEA